MTRRGFILFKTNNLVINFGEKKTSLNSIKNKKQLCFSKTPWQGLGYLMLVHKLTKKLVQLFKLTYSHPTRNMRNQHRTEDVNLQQELKTAGVSLTLLTL